MARNNKDSFFIILFVLLVEFSLVTANIIATTIPAAYAEKGGRAAVPVAAVMAETVVAMVMKVATFVAAIQRARQSHQQQARFYCWQKLDNKWSS
jgi:hypothetical protein